MPDESGRQRLRIVVFGGFRLLEPGGREVTLSGRKAAALITYLALCPGSSATRDKLAGLLWNDSDDEHARNSLRQTLSRLRQELPEADQDLVVSNRSTVALRSGAADCDAHRLMKAQSADSRPELEAAVDGYAGPFLDGFFSGSRAFEDWAASERERFSALAVDALEKLARRTPGDDGLAHVRRLLLIDPTREASYRLDMELSSARGHRTRALDAYENCKAMLQEEFGVAPSPETTALWQAIQAPDGKPGTVPSAAARSAASPVGPSRASIGILQFVNLTNKESDDHFARGLMQDISTALSRFSEYAVLTKALPYGGAAASGNDVQYVLNGSVQRAADELRVHIQLTDATSGHHVWAERFDGEAGGLFGFQDRITETICHAVQVELQLTSWHVRDQSPPGSAEVRRLVNQARVTYYEYTRDSLLAAKQFAEDALAIDPGNARSMRTLSLAISVGMAFGALPYGDAHAAKALMLAETAVRAVPDDEISRSALAYALLYAGRVVEGIAELKYGISLNPDYPHLRSDLAEQYGLLGQAEDALREVNESTRHRYFELPDFWRLHSTAVAKFGAGDDHGALEAAHKAIRSKPGFVRGALYWAAAAAAAGNSHEASRAMHHCLSQVPGLRLGNVCPGIVPRYVSDHSHRRFLEMLRRAGMSA